jgi:osmoprotectant transport system permease protein
MMLWSDPRWSDALSHLPDYLGSHIRVSLAALTLGLLISFPLALVARNRPRLRGTLLGFASIVQTVPGLALLALFYPLLLALAALSAQWLGFSFSAFGFLPSVLALALYSMLPVLRNTITGLQGVDAAITEAAQGVGMTPRQSLLMVELPLALPVIMAGLRVATVSTVALTTVGSLVAYGGLGNLIKDGVLTNFRAELFTASVLCVLLAVVLDVLLVLAQRLLTPWTRGARA